MNSNEIYTKLTEILKQKLEVKVDLSEKTALVGESILDSLEFMNYITIVEEEFNLSISDDDIQKYQLGIIENMVDYINKNE